MLTIFTTAKPFRGHDAVIQRNAIESWTRLHPDIEIILFGDDEGAAEVAHEFGLRHEPRVERNEFGTKRIDYMFSRAQSIARHDVLCYSNCDILLMDDFCPALEHVCAVHREFLMIGQRTDVSIFEPWPFYLSNWDTKLREFASRNGKRRPPNWVDYFAFSRGLFGADVPPFVVGRVFWDNWLVWKILTSKKSVVDVTPVVFAVHQNHDYGYHPQGEAGVWKGMESNRNSQLAGGWEHLRTIADATEMLVPTGIVPNPRRRWSAAKRGLETIWRFWLYRIWRPAWFAFLNLTRPLRDALGLRARRLP